MGGLAGVLASVGSSVGAAAESIGSVVSGPMQGFAKGVNQAAEGAYNAGKDKLAQAWNAANSDRAGDVAYETGKALFSANYAKQPAPKIENDQPNMTQSNERAPDAGEELNKLMSNMTE